MDKQEPPVNPVDTQQVRQVVREEVTTVITAAGFVTEDDMVKTVRRVLKTELTKELASLNAKVTALDAYLRDTQQRATAAENAMNQISGKLDALNSGITSWITQSIQNQQSITQLREQVNEVQRDIYGDTQRPHERSLIGELEKIPGLIEQTIQAALAPQAAQIATLTAAVELNTKFRVTREGIENGAKRVLTRVMKTGSSAVQSMTSRMLWGALLGALLAGLLYFTGATTGVNWVEIFTKVLSGGKP